MCIRDSPRDRYPLPDMELVMQYLVLGLPVSFKGMDQSRIPASVRIRKTVQCPVQIFRRRKHPPVSILDIPLLHKYNVDTQVPQIPASGLPGDLRRHKKEKETGKLRLLYSRFYICLLYTSFHTVYFRYL